MLYTPGQEADTAWAKSAARVVSAGDAMVLVVGRLPAMSSLELTLVVAPKLAGTPATALQGRRRSLLQSDFISCWTGGFDMIYSDPCDESKSDVPAGLSIILRCVHLCVYSSRRQTCGYVRSQVRHRKALA